MQKLLDSEKLASVLRKKAVNFRDRKILISRFHGSKQESDLSLPVNCCGFGRLHCFRQLSDDSWPLDPLPMCPVNRFINIGNMDSLLTQVFQLAVCNFRCWYCFVDSDMLLADEKFSDFVSPKQLLKLVFSESDEFRVIDLSGGQPDIVPEYTLWFLQAREELNLNNNCFIWVDDNLSTDYFWRYLKDDEIDYMINSKGFSRVGCLKGFDSKSFTFNTGADGKLFDRQIKLLSKFVKAGFDQYGYIVFTTPNCSNLRSKISFLLDKLQNDIHENFPLRVVPLRIFKFNANKERYNQQADENQFHVLEAWQSEMQTRFSESQLTIPVSEVKIGDKQ